jgi:hypothetical protein
MNRLLRPLMRIRSKLCGRAGQHQNSEFTMRPPPSVLSAKDEDISLTEAEGSWSERMQVVEHVSDWGKSLKPGQIWKMDSPSTGQYKMEPLKKQIGGEHYTVRAIQPIEYINANRMGFCEGNVIKYVTRYKEKDGKKDLEKAIHYLQLLIQMEYGDTEQAKEIAVGVSWSDEILRKEQEKLKRDEDTAAKYGVVYHETYTPT